jgi:hypothetical protein
MRSTVKTTATLFVPFLLVALACGVDTPPPREGSFLDRADAGTASLPPPQPLLDPVPARVPWPVLPLKGRALRAHRIVIEEGGRTITERVLPDGTFCIDLPIDGAGQHSFVVWAQNADGEFSERAATAASQHDPAAPRPAGASLCDGSDPAMCTGRELCGNGVDDDCNGRVDEFDTACSDCPVDALEPNDGPDGPRVEPGVYSSLEICGGDRDFHPVYAEMGQEIVARVRFAHAEGDLNARLIDVEYDRVLVTSTGTEDDETLRHEVTHTGTYAIEVYGSSDDPNTYTLELEVR